jgi:hypothetical protein
MQILKTLPWQQAPTPVGRLSSGLSPKRLAVSGLSAVAALVAASAASAAASAARRRGDQR